MFRLIWLGQDYTLHNAYWEMNVAQPAGATRQSNFLLLNADFNLLFKADGFSVAESAGMSAYKPDMSGGLELLDHFKQELKTLRYF